MIPDYDDNGYLPLGIHRATMEELAKEYGVGIGSIWRSLQSGTKNKAQEVSYGLT